MTYLEFEAVLSRVDTKIKNIQIRSEVVQWRDVYEGRQLGGIAEKMGLISHAITVKSEVSE